MRLEQVKFIPAKDLQTVDALWRAASGGKFGYSAQKELWLQNRRYWEKFFKAIDWVQVLTLLMSRFQMASRPSEHLQAFCIPFAARSEP